MRGWRTWTPTARRSTMCSRASTGRTPSRSGAHGGGSSSWPAPSCSATAAAPNGSCRTIASRRGRTDMLKAFLMAAVGFPVLDGVWFGVLMSAFYRRELAGIARMRDGQLTPVWSTVAPVYVLLAIGLAVFVIPRAPDVWSAAKYGALFGLIVYGVFDLTNFSTLANYSPTLTVIDMSWGVVATGVCAAAVKALV